MKETTVNKPIARRFALLATAALFTWVAAIGANAGDTLEKMTVAGWSKPITEITHLLVEPDGSRELSLCAAPNRRTVHIRSH
jgi:hypothetical protein